MQRNWYYNYYAMQQFKQKGESIISIYSNSRSKCKEKMYRSMVEPPKSPFFRCSCSVEIETKSPYN
jgi:hypothetical protein